MRWNDYSEDPPEAGTVIFARAVKRKGIYLGAVPENGSFKCMSLMTGNTNEIPIEDLRLWIPADAREDERTADEAFEALGYFRSSFVPGLYVMQVKGGTRKIRVRPDGSSWVTQYGDGSCFTAEETEAVWKKIREGEL